jgi:hypothetical protein
MSTQTYNKRIKFARCACPTRNGAAPLRVGLCAALGGEILSKTMIVKAPFNPRLFRAIRPGLGILLTYLFLLAICVIIGLVLGKSVLPDAIVPIFLGLAATVAIIGLAAEYLRFRGRAWRFALGAAGTMLWFIFVMLWRTVRTGDAFETTNVTWAWLFGLSASVGILGMLCFSDESAQQAAARDRVKKRDA